MNKRTVNIYSAKKSKPDACIHCRSSHIIRYGKQANNKQRYLCMDCKKSSNERSGTAFFRKKTSESDILRIVYLFLTGYPMEHMVPFMGLTEKSIRRILGDAILHFTRIGDLRPKPEDYEPEVIMFDEIYVD